ncbi:S-DNA-T family DNA segregation ATPase FtsK/SpoIIIE [Cryobacterium sp. MP_3.1]|uniref:FtsK/SpoIIIE domain-containing protein n=1 Tax=Cryobacterium sp. MP_3.1 TaxID=3071711 RepID=UPI002DF968D1|nr:S-DNA-T family DNA segregation ATPase FtsK/SpoIIIE [Cryobacterium sp. MP_3.1]
MKLRLAVKDVSGVVGDVVVTADVTATVSDIARHLSSRTVRGTPGLSADTAGAQPPGLVPDLTLRAEYPGRTQARLLNPSATIHESNLRSGCTVEVVSSLERREGDDLFGTAAAIVRVLEGPDAGNEFTIATGVNYVGGAPDSQVPLTDPHVSRRHASITVGDTISVTDLNSATGVTVDGALCHRSLLSASSRLQLGASVLMVIPLTVPAGASAEPAAADFSRSPRVEPVYLGRTFTAPELPNPPEKQRFPTLALIAPVVMGAVLFAATRQVYTLLFIAMAPIILLGTWIDNRIQGRRKGRAENARFDAAVVDLEASLAEERESQIDARLAESPSAAAIAAAMQEHSALLWTRKPEHASFLEVRLGLGAQRSRSTVALPSKHTGTVDEWHRVNAIIDEYAQVDGVPVVENLARCGALGIAGSSTLAADAARAVITQLVGLHSPADLVVTAFAGGDATADWAWLKWLPHVNSPHSPLRVNGLAADFPAATALLAALEGLIAARRTAGSGAEQVRSRLTESRTATDDLAAAVDRLPARPAIIVLVTNEAPADRSRLVALSEEGADHGVFLVWLAPSVAALPVVCRTYLDVQPDGTNVGFVRVGRTVALAALETVDPVGAATAARALAPVEDIGARVLDETDLPHSVNFLDLYDGDVADDTAAVLQRWVKNDSLSSSWVPGTPREAGGIRALVGQGASEPFYLDLRTHGPHALVGGTTGSGKSEFLQTWIMGIAAEYAPDRVTFLLVDYKGGAAFAECVDLPHTVGLVTDLNPHLVRRALTSLRAELRFREHLLNSKGAKDLETLEKRSDPDAPPALILMIDEFAALASEVPEFVDGVIDVAQRGRSLGLHLVMATQRPAGVIKDSLRANTNLRVALRVADEADSHDVLGVADAAGFDPGTPGRAAAKLGPGRVLDFQTAYLGGLTPPASASVPAPDVEVADLSFGPGATWASNVARTRSAGGARDIERLARTIAGAADSRALALPRKPWLDQLPALFDLAGLPVAGEGLLPVGMLDEPEEQRQSPFVLDLDTIGNLVILGTGGAGKTAALRTIAVAASAAAETHPVAVYGLDFAGGGLSMLESLPTVGAVIAGDDTERATRLFKDLAELVDDRAARFALARAGSLGDYRRITAVAEPRVLVLMDGMAAFRADYEFRGAGELFDRFLKLAATGRQVGVHFVLTADRSGALPTQLLANVGQRLVLRLAGESEYSAAGVRPDVLADAVPGRGLVDGHEVQLAVPGGTADLTAQSTRVEELAARLRAAGVDAATGVERLAAHIPLADLPAQVAGRPTLGVSDENLEPVGVPLDGLFVVTGPFGSGRTTTMTTILQSVRATRPELRPYLLVGRRSALADVTDWAELSTDADEAEALAVRLATVLEQPATTGSTDVLIVVENVGDFEGLPAEGAVARLIKAARRSGVPVIAETDTVTAASAWQIYSELKTARAGIVLQPEETDGLSLFRTPFPRVTRSDFPPGRGLLVDAGRAIQVQVAFPRPLFIHSVSKETHP